MFETLKVYCFLFYLASLRKTIEFRSVLLVNCSQKSGATNCDESVIGLDGAKRFGKSARFFAASVCQQVTDCPANQQKKKHDQLYYCSIQLVFLGPDLEPVTTDARREFSPKKESNLQDFLSFS